MLLIPGTGNGERGTGNGEPGTGVWELMYSGHLVKNSTPRCGFAEKCLHIICVSLNSKRIHCIMPRSLTKNF